MRRIALSWVAVITITVVTGGCSKTDSTKPSSSAQPAGRTAPVGTGGAGADIGSDGEFVHDVAIMNMGEIELSRIALERATSADVKAFAQRMIDDHGAAADKLKGLLSGQQSNWPAQTDEKHTKAADELRKKQGADFEREYAEAMVEGHQNFTALLESRLDVESVANWKTAAAGRTRSQALPDPKAEMGDVKVRPATSEKDFTAKINQWAADTYPVAQKHLDTARTLENAIKKRSTH